MLYTYYSTMAASFHLIDSIVTDTEGVVSLSRHFYLCCYSRLRTETHTHTKLHETHKKRRKVMINDSRLDFERAVSYWSEFTWLAKTTLGIKAFTFYGSYNDCFDIFRNTIFLDASLFLFIISVFYWSFYDLSYFYVWWKIISPHLRSN